MSLEVKYLAKKHKFGVYCGNKLVTEYKTYEEAVEHTNNVGFASWGIPEFMKSA